MKTKLGISTGLMAAIVCFVALFNGIGMAFLLLAGYILLCESDEWLKYITVKVLLFSIAVSLLSIVIGFIPSIIGVINDIIEIFNGNYLGIEWLTDIVYFIQGVLSFGENVILVLLGIKALSRSTLRLPIIDEMANKL